MKPNGINAKADAVSARLSALQAGGPRFESVTAHHNSSRISLIPLGLSGDPSDTSRPSDILLSQKVQAVCRQNVVKGDTMAIPVPKRGADQLGSYSLIEVADGVSIKVDPPLESFVRTLRMGVTSEKSGKWVYAFHRIIGYGTRIPLHRILIGAFPGEVVDHINGDTLDNRLRNLRICTNAENARNSRKRAGSGSQFKGVTRIKGTNRWRAQIMVNGQKRNLGSFRDEESAAKCYDAKARELHGEFAKCNFPVAPATPEAVPHA